MKDSQMLRLAAQRIRERGWRDGGKTTVVPVFSQSDGMVSIAYYSRRNVGLCVLEALGTIQSCKWQSVEIPSALVRIARAELMRLGYSGPPPANASETVYFANDHSAQSADGVLAMLHTAAFVAEREEQSHEMPVASVTYQYDPQCEFVAPVFDFSTA